VLNILGIGSFYPTHRISNTLLYELNKNGSEAHTFFDRVLSRHSVLPAAYLKETANSDPRMTPEAVEANPSDLAYQASLEAIKRAGIKITDIGMIVGETSTPHQTTPSEAQRVGNRLRLRRCPQYDVVDSAGAALALHINILSSWKEEALPEYILCLSSNTPTALVNYEKPGIESAIFGDAAGALVLSPRKSGKLKVVDSFYALEVDSEDSLVFDLFKHVVLREDAVRLKLARRTAEMLKQLEKKVGDMSSLKIIGTQFDREVFEKECVQYGISLENNWHDLEERGSSIGADAFCSLSDRWESFQSGDKIAVVLSGFGRGYGYVLVSVV